MFRFICLFFFQILSLHTGSVYAQQNQNPLTSGEQGERDIVCEKKHLGKLVVSRRDGGSSEEWMVFSKTGVQPLIVIRAINNNQPVWQFEFTGLGFKGEILKGTASDPSELICKKELLNEWGLDTLKAEIFSTLHPAGSEKMSSFGNKNRFNEKSIVPDRNKTAEILISENQIAQDTVVIGTFVESSVDGVSGKLSQLTIYNSVGAMICTATGVPVKGEQWSLLTYRDNRFYALKLGDDQALIECVRFLIEEGLM